jgi:hypothetical protein
VPAWKKTGVPAILALTCAGADGRRHPQANSALAGRAREARNAGKPVSKKPYQINSCHIYKDDAPAVLERWPDFYTGKR